MSALLSSFAASLQDEEDAALTTQSDLSFTPRQSLWEHVSSLLQPAERNEAKLVIGAALILDNQQLHNEVRSLLDMVTCLQTSTTLSDPTPPTTNSHSATATAVSVPSIPLLNGVPPLRLRGFEADRTEYLKGEVAQLIAAIRDKARQRGDSDTDRIWTPKSDREKSIVDMVEREKDSARTTRSNTNRSSRCSTGRPSTASTSRSASSTSVSASRPTSSSMLSALSSTVESLSTLSIFTLDSAVTRIQSALQSEREELMRDIEYLRSIIHEEEEQQADDRRWEEEQGSVMAPSEKELQSLNKQLKQAVAEEESADRTRRLLGNLPTKASFSIAKVPLSPLTSTSTAAVATGEAQLASEVNCHCPPAVRSEESVESMLSSLDDMEAAFFNHTPSQSATAAEVSSALPPSPSPATSSPVLSPHSSTIPRPSASSVFTIRPSSSVPHLSFASVSPSPRSRSSALSKSSMSDASKRVISRRTVIVDT